MTPPAPRTRSIRSRLLRLFAALLLAFIPSAAAAAGPLARVGGWLEQLSGTEERLVHLERVGPYLVSADGDRLLDAPWLAFDITLDGEPIPADSEVRLVTTLFSDDLQETRVLPVRARDGRFVADLDLVSARAWAWDRDGWLRTQLAVDGPAGSAEGTFGFAIFPSRPTVSGWFRAGNALLPVVLTLLLWGAFRIAGARLGRPARPA